MNGIAAGSPFAHPRGHCCGPIAAPSGNCADRNRRSWEQRTCAPFGKVCPARRAVGVGIMIAHNPLHRSGRADFPHPAPTSGNDAHAAQRKRMIYAHRRKPAVDQAPHPIPRYSAILASARKRPMPEPAYLESERAQRVAVHGHSVIADMSTHHRPQPLACVLNGSVHAQSQLGFHCVQLRLQPLTNRLPYYVK